MKRPCHQIFSLIREVGEYTNNSNIGKKVKNGLRGIKIKPYRSPKEGGVTFTCDSRLHEKFKVGFGGICQV